jgi:formylglycine-generating enzyme required for sulfatase activity
MKKTLGFFVFAVLITGLTMAVPAYANHIQVGIPTLAGQNTTADYVDVQFDLSWENSWRRDIAGAGESAPYNYDAAWLFVKFKVTSGDWKHATLNTTAGNHTAPTGSTITPSSDGKGVFIYRSSNGTGSNDWNNVKLRWEYGIDSVLDGDNVTVKVFGVEMVYVSQDTLNLNTAVSGNIYNEFTSAGITQITNENALADSAIQWSYDNQSGGRGSSDALGASYPKGYAAFYCMKYEVSQEQYAVFLNTLTSIQTGNRYPDQNGTLRHTISGSHPNFSASRPDRACNYLSWMDGCAYMDWTGLRPMTELEFEKACRGNQAVVTDEFAWGNTTITAATTINNGVEGDEDGTEIITNSGANCCYNNQTFSGGNAGQGPLRCGIFTTSSTTTRQQTGASYYGIMELSGNLYERCVTVADQDRYGNTTDAGTFDGSHGDGALSTSGDADVSNWPGTDAKGAGQRGGSWSLSPIIGRVSDRYYAADTNTIRGNNYGFRGVRSAP